MQVPTQLDNAFYQRHIDILAKSYRRFTQQNLFTTPPSVTDCFKHPNPILSHGTQADPVFNFANQAALQLFEYSFEQFLQTPSRLSAEPVERSQREQLLQQVTQHGHIKNYSGVRISASGKRFMIAQAVVWNLYDADDNYYGQAATFSTWEYL